MHLQHVLSEQRRFSRPKNIREILCVTPNVNARPDVLFPGVSDTELLIFDEIKNPGRFHVKRAVRRLIRRRPERADLRYLRVIMRAI